MTSNESINGKIVCWLTCWAVAALAAIMAGYMLSVFAGLGSIACVFLALVILAAGGVILSTLLCSPLPMPASAPARMPVAPPKAAPPKAAPAPKAAAPAPAPAPAPAAAPASAAPEPAPASAPMPMPEPAAKPATLDAARDGKADDLKQIKGVGPKMEQMLNGMGFYHFDQIAAWTAAEVAWVDDNLEGFKGRVSRDNWVEQAKVLAGGGETEFSKRVEDGDVY